MLISLMRQGLHIKSSLLVVSSIPISCSQSIRPPKYGFSQMKHMKKLTFASAKPMRLLK